MFSIKCSGILLFRKTNRRTAIPRKDRTWMVGGKNLRRKIPRYSEVCGIIYRVMVLYRLSKTCYFDFFCRITSPFLVLLHPFWYYITLFPILLHPFGIIFTLFSHITSSFWYYFHTFGHITSPFWCYFRTFSRLPSIALLLTAANPE